jgi:hypothetical protein
MLTYSYRLIFVAPVLEPSNKQPSESAHLKTYLHGRDWCLNQW